LASTSLQIELPERYRLIRHVASGGMAAVYAADDELLGRRVAVKVLAPGLAADPSARIRFRREARAAARVSDHPHVVTIYDVGGADHEAFIVMELLPGGTLNDRLKRGDPIPHAEAVRWLRETASALDAAHRVDVVHRDVKPANLLLDERGSVRVGDFGIATLASETSVTQTGQVVGTAAYLSPEQAMGRAATPASDRYALAVVAFELLTGRRPFTAPTPTAQALAHVDAAPPWASDVAANLPPGVDAVLSRGLAKEPAERPATAMDLVSELESALGATAPTRAVEPRTQRFAAAAAPPPGIAIPDPDRPQTQRPSAGQVGGGEPVEHNPVRSRERPSRLRPLALLAAIALVLGAGIAALASSGGGSGGDTSRSKRTHAAKRPASTPAAAPAAGAAPAPPAGGPSAAEVQAHQLIQQGAYDQAIPILQNAVQGCPVQRTDPCAYALYDLAYALVKAGRPQEAVPYLAERLRNPDQRGTVTALLRAAQGGATPAPGEKTKGPKKHGGGKGHEGD
jgi:eukaryotic-like serine/threonine-protein kinase